MADKNLNSFDLTKDLSSKDRATVARNLMYIERMKNNMSPTSTNSNAAAAAEERRILQEREASERRIAQEREESERRMLREREESERRITEEQERRARLEVEQEERLERMRAIAEAESYDRQLDFEQERMHKRMALSYKYYDRNYELHYYYDDRGDYIDTAAARSLWQRIHCESYTTYDPADTFWEYFLDDKGNVITRAQAFELWQPAHCPDYLDYEPDGFWTKYRCGEGFIPADEAKEKWLTEKAESPEVRRYICSQKTDHIADRLIDSFGLPHLNSELKDTCKHLLEEVDSAEAAKNHLISVRNVFGGIFCLLLFTAFVLFCMGLDSFTKDIITKYHLDTVKTLSLLGSFVLFCVWAKVNSKVNEKTKFADEKRERNTKYIENCKDCIELLSEVNSEIKEALEEHLTLRLEHSGLAASVQTISNISEALHRLTRAGKRKTFPKELCYEYHVIEAEIPQEAETDEGYAPILAFLLGYANMKRRDFSTAPDSFDLSSSEYSEQLHQLYQYRKCVVDIVYLSSEGARKIADMLCELGIKCKVRTRTATLLERG